MAKVSEKCCSRRHRVHNRWLTRIARRAYFSVERHVMNEESGLVWSLQTDPRTFSTAPEQGLRALAVASPFSWSPWQASWTWADSQGADAATNCRRDRGGETVRNSAGGPHAPSKNSRRADSAKLQKQQFCSESPERRWTLTRLQRKIRQCTRVPASQPVTKIGPGPSVKRWQRLQGADQQTRPGGLRKGGSQKPRS
ncbi:hypothetical protein BU26DRAFT_525746 [Trematosphaeria pertusa]|uniref:Uncharacterized protein n=1 Tax=Trematosphaeria pertusa TaxID=390896 RepID=A0A6A6HRR6_9PLEO|nr:uncharacterized protein BU26DRAFT_525746 [Trematosphaeria pertusa]KAF2240845.1 hypothetical protein BU26DRAFT_525746 [Trematosphaeria pertusa]